MNKHECRERMNKAYASWFWYNRHRNLPDNNPLKIHSTQQQRVDKILEYRRHRALLKTDLPEEQDEFGNTILRDAEADRAVGLCNRDLLTRNGSRYILDNHLQGWRQYDTNQDAWYFGVWVNLEERKVFSYCEGDRTLVICPTAESFKAQLDSMARFYGPAPAAFICLNQKADGQWEREDIYLERPSV